MARSARELLHAHAQLMFGASQLRGKMGRAFLQVISEP